MRLERLEIESYALIDRATLEFAPGLTVVTGETGSGKTMLLGALDFALGGRSSADVVRAGAARARVTLEIDPGDELRRSFEETGFAIEPDEHAVLVREMTAAGKSSARVNGHLATSAHLRDIGDRLIESVGQHEQQHLLQASYQLDALDRFAGSLARAREVAESHARVAVLARELEAERSDVGRAEAELAFATFALGEIDAVTPQPGEDLLLRERREVLASIERIERGLATAREALSGDGGALESLGAAAAAVTSLERLGGLAELAAQVRALQSEANDALAAIARALDATEAQPGELETLGERLDALENLKRKYGDTLEAVLESRERFLARLDREATRDERLRGLAGGLAEARATLDTAAARLGKERGAAARELERRIGHELATLAMPAARFDCGLRPVGSIGPRGAERVEFELAPNAGERSRPLAKAASGGELSRVLLALVASLAERRAPAAFVFDEIDAGIGGATARAVGSRLGALATSGQVVCVTHLAQIAAWGDAHYALRKHELAGATSIELERLDDGDEALEELARMLSGSATTPALEHARSLQGDVHREKRGSLSA